MLKLSRRQIDHEDVVAQGYAALRRAALYLARGDEAEAGDLLHDTFVRFLLLRPRLDTISNLDGYLYTMLRNVYLSRQRRHVRRRALVTDDVDVDLLAAMVDEPEPGERLRMRDDLMRLVDHACERTRVSRAASAWILRCVHGYYPAEIARLMKMAPRAVDRALHVARREALEELRKPAARRREGGGGRGSAGGGQRWRDLHVDAHANAGMPSTAGVHANVGMHAAVDAGVTAADPLDTLQALRIRLFASADGACLSDDSVAELYRPLSETGAGSGSGSNADSSSGSDESDAPAGTLLMAHVVACAGCLDRINHHLDLPPLKTRDPVESNGTRQRRGGGPGDSGESGGRGGPGGQAGTGTRTGAGTRPGTIEHRGEARGGSASRGGGTGLDPLLRRTRDTLASIVDHVPQELRIAANGLELGALPVAGVVTVQELAVRLAESLAFVEIFDERGALVCYWPAQVPNAGVMDDDITIELPDGRLIELRVSLMEDCPRLRVRYTDARLGSAASVRAGASARVGAGVDGDACVSVGVGSNDGPREVRRSPRAGKLFADAPRRLAWWYWFVLPPRMAIVGGVLVVLWMILIGPATTWAAIEHLGRAAAAVIRTLMTSPPSVTPAPSAPPAAPTEPAASSSSSAIAPPRAAAPARVFSPSELSELEMAVRVALHDVRADLGEDITLRATPAGVAVQGVVGGVARRDSIARALANLDGALVNVRTADEVSALARVRGASRRLPAARRGDSTASTPTSASAPASMSASASAPESASSSASATEAESGAAAGKSPVFVTPMQKALAERMPAPVDRAAFVNDTLARADEALARAWALRRLADRYEPRDVTALSRRSSQSLATLVDDHTAALRTAVDVLITRVTPLVDAAEALDAQSSATRDGASREQEQDRQQRLSIMELFTLVNGWHADAHALLAASSADRPDALRLNPREWLIRLYQIRDALKQSAFPM